MPKTFLSGASAGKEIVLNFEGKNSLYVEMKQIEVVAAIICREGKYFATQRGYGEFKDYWEFPGGKIITQLSTSRCTAFYALSVPVIWC